LWQHVTNIDRVFRQTQVSTIQVEELLVEVVRKTVRRVHLTVRPPQGEVRISVPFFMGDAAVYQAVINRLAWIRKHRVRLQSQVYPVRPAMVSGDSLLWLGQAYRLEVHQTKGAGQAVQDRPGIIDLHVRPTSTIEQREAILYAWYRVQFKLMLPGLLATWEPVIGVQAAAWGIKRMKTRWGSCNTVAKRIWFSLELAKKPGRCIEYVVVHELVHLLEPSHNMRFKALMTRFLPQWPQLRQELNQSAPLNKNWEC
jgi:predicted metal-dependent hydrolase